MFNRISRHLGIPSDATASEAAREAASEAQARAREGLSQAREGLGGLVSTTREQIIRHPAPALAVALALGATLGWLIKRP